MPASVLSVEDDDGMALLLRMAFEESCPDLILDRVPNAPQALQRLRRDSGLARPHVILLDIHLPAMDGVDFLGHVKSDDYTRDISVVIFSASLRESERKRCAELGASHFCRKGDSFEEILSVVKQICEIAESRAA